MSTKSKTQASKKGINRDLATFEKLPEKTKELMKLKAQDEKNTGREQVVTTRKIQEKTRKPRP